MKLDNTVEVKTYDLLSEKCQKNGTNHNIKLEMILSIIICRVLFYIQLNTTSFYYFFQYSNSIAGGLEVRDL